MANPVPMPDNLMHGSTQPAKPRVILAATGSVAAIKFENLCRSFSDWAEVKAVATKSSLHFIEKSSLPRDVSLYTDDEEWSSWKKIGDGVLHIELRKWADIMVTAPLSANTLAKGHEYDAIQYGYGDMDAPSLLVYSNIAGGLCDNLLTCIVRAWDYNKPLYVAPAMNTFMWNNPFTRVHLDTMQKLGISIIPPITKRLACGDFGNGAMAEPSEIYNTVRLSLNPRLVNG